MDGFDVLIVGAGPAGSAAALSALSERPDARVALVDRAAFPRDKVCGDGLTPAAASALEEPGLTDILGDGTAVGQWQVTGPGGHHFTATLPKPAHVLPRRVLDARLVAAATSRGAELIQARVTDLDLAKGRVVVNGRWSAPCPVAADGANSVVRARLGVPRHPLRHTPAWRCAGMPPARRAQQSWTSDSCRGGSGRPTDGRSPSVTEPPMSEREPSTPPHEPTAVN